VEPRAGSAGSESFLFLEQLSGNSVGSNQFRTTECFKSVCLDRALLNETRFTTKDNRYPQAKSAEASLYPKTDAHTTATCATTQAHTHTQTLRLVFTTARPCKHAMCLGVKRDAVNDELPGPVTF
jgi:hypothetical protein